MKNTIITLTFVAFTAPTFADTFIVTANPTSWSPDELHVVPGDVLRFEYGSGYPHTITSGSGCTFDGMYFNESLNSPGDYYEWIVPEGTPTEIPFFCDPHCKMGMTGVIIVDEVLDPPVDINIGIVDIDCYFHYTKNSDGEVQIHFSELWNDKVSRASFAWGMEVDDDEDIEIYVSAATADGGELFVHRTSDGSETPLVTGPMTLFSGEKYLFHGSCDFYGEFSVDIEWTEEYANAEDVFVIIDVEGDGSLCSTADNVLLRASNDQWASLTIDALEDLELPVTVIADVSSSTLTLPASGEDGNVPVTVGTHTFLVGNSTEGVLMLRFDQGNDGGMPEDVTGDGIVDVSDLLAVISAWGSTSP